MPHWSEISESRSLAAEIKFLVPVAAAGAVREWARARLGPDPYGEGPAGDTYWTRSLYFDTAAFDVLLRRGSYGRSKYRIRRYGETGEVFLERKLRKRNMVSKRRSSVALDQLHRLDGGEPARGWAGYWFHRRILARELRPVCQISYCRTARVGAGTFGPTRLTLDEQISVQPADRLHLGRAPDGEPVVPGHAILEFKYHREAPPILAELEKTFQLVPQAVSKYRLAMRTEGAPHAIDA